MGRSVAKFGPVVGIALTVALVAPSASSARATSAAPRTDQAPTRTGFVSPFAGTAEFEHLAPKQLTKSRQLNKPIGQAKAHRIAKGLRLKKSATFSKKQFRLFVSGKGVGGNRADVKLVDASVRILTNTRGRPLISKTNGYKTSDRSATASQLRGDSVVGRKITRSVLASYGVMVNTDGLLQSPANASAPTRQVNSVLAPGGYLGQWSRANGAKKSLRQLYESAYTLEAVYGNQAQQQSGVAQLVTNKKSAATTTVGMSMAPALWLVNFALIYTLKPSLAAKMPARWAPIPPRAAKAIAKSPTGQVPYKRYASLFD